MSDASPARTTRGTFDLIFVSMEDWDDIWRRNQFLCAGLARRFPQMKILFVVPPRNVGRSLKAGNLKALMTDPAWRVPGYENITVTSPLRIGPERYRWGIKVNELLARRHVGHIARRLGLRSPLLWLNPHYAHHMAGTMGERAVVYDITDDWTLATLPPKERETTLRQDQRLCGRADLVVVCSEALAASRQPMAKRLLLLPNAVDASHYAAVAEHDAQGARGPWAPPAFGYTGTLHPDRIDLGLVVSLARAHPTGNVILIGPNHLGPDLTAKLSAEPNIILHAPVPYAEIPRHMRDFDVFIVPHLESKFTDSLNPIKLWEYLAAGKPIASTAVAGFRDFAHLCHVGSGTDGFLGACRAALAENGTLIARRQAEAAGNSWASRLDRLLEELRTIGCET